MKGWNKGKVKREKAKVKRQKLKGAFGER